MTLDGQIILYTGEVRTNWLNVIRNIPNFEHSLKNIPLVEKALSQNLRNIKIVHRKIGEGPLRLVDDYKRQLMRLVTNVSDYLARQKLPKHWPETLDNFELCVDNESSSLAMSASGQFLVPASCPGTVWHFTNNLRIRGSFTDLPKDKNNWHLETCRKSWKRYISWFTC